MKFVRILSASALALAMSAVAASATPITYVHTGFGSGTVGNTTFGALAPVAFTINATSDTSTVQSCGTLCVFNDNVTASITIGGVGTLNFVTGTRFFANNGFVGFSRAGSGGLDLFSGPSGPLWDMTTSYGPIAGSGSLLQWSTSPVVTSGGTLFFNSGNSEATFRATVGNAAVPEPASLLLLGSGLALAALRRRRL